jgi:hypothetical protein
VWSTGDGYFVPLKGKKTENYSGPVINLQIENEENYTTGTGLKKNCRFYGQYSNRSWDTRIEGLSKRLGIGSGKLPMGGKQCRNIRVENGNESLAFKDEDEKEYTQLQDFLKIEQPELITFDEFRAADKTILEAKIADNTTKLTAITAAKVATDAKVSVEVVKGK